MRYETYELGDLCEIRSSKRIYAKDYSEEGISFYRSKEIIQKHNQENITTELFITEEQFNSIKEKYGIPIEGDILLTSVGTLGIPYLVQKGDRFYFKDGNLTWFSSFNEKLNNKFLYYWFTSNDGKCEIERVTIGSTQKALTIVNLKKLKIQLPPLNIQNSIVNILEKLNLKLINNLSIIRKLEDLSKSLFEHWFIDFEFPNQDGVPYKSNGGKMMDSGLGEIPEGWSLFNLSDFTQSISNSINKKEMKKARFLNTSDVLEGKVEHPELTDTEKLPGQAKKLIQYGDILYSEIRPKNKRFAYVNFSSEEYVVSTKLMVLRVDETIYSGKLLYLWLTMKNTIDELQQIAEDRSGTFPQITFSILAKYKFVIPSKSILEKLAKPLEKIIGLQLQLKEENEKLEDLRDSLLPKLLSGEIEIPDESVVK